MRVFITNAIYRNTLAAVRSLGKKGVYIGVGGHNKGGFGFYSKYCRERKLYTSPRESPSSFIHDIIKILSGKRYDVLLPIGTDTTVPTSFFKNKLVHHAHVPVADYEILVKAHDKSQAINIAEKIGIPTPKTILPKGVGEVKRIAKEIEYPVIIKARKGAGALTDVRTASSPKELVSRYREIQSFSDSTPSHIVDDFRQPMIQEYVPGEIRDVCVLFNEGKVMAACAQRRVLTYPLSGGFGIMNETIEDRQSRNLALKLLNELRWHGVAQVEFKLDANGVPKLMEVNPKFWGTLELSIAAGIDFPHLLCKMALDGDVKPVFNYEKNLQFWWFSSNLSFLLVSLCSNPKKTLINLFSPRKKAHDVSLRDPVPISRQLWAGARRIILRGRETFEQSRLL